MWRGFVPAGPEQVGDVGAGEGGGLVSYGRAQAVAPYVIYGPELSYFTRKLHAALHWAHVAYRWLPKHSAIAHALEARADTHQIPVLITPENWAVADTTPQLHMLDERLPHAIFFPTFNRRRGISTAVTGALVHIVEEYLDEWMPRAAIVWRWAHADSAQHAAALLGRDSASGMGQETQEMAGRMIQAWGTKALRALGVSEEHEQKAVEAEFIEVFTALEKHIEKVRASMLKGQVFVLGSTPCAVDAVLAGSLWAHFASDPAAVSALKEHCPGVLTWADDLTTMPSGSWRWQEHEPLDLAQVEGSFFGAILGLMGGPYMCFLRANASALAAKQKAFRVDVYQDGHEVSVLTRTYPELSRRQTSRWINVHLSPTEREELQHLLARYRLDDFLTHDGLEFHSRL